MLGQSYLYSFIPVLREAQSGPLHMKSNNLGFRPGLTQTSLYSHRKGLEALNVEFKKKKNCTIRVAKTKALISCAVTAQPICALFYLYCANALLMIYEYS